MDNNVLRSLSYGVYVLSSAFEGRQNACIINTFVQISSEPKKVAMAVNKDNFTAEIIKSSGVFCGSVLLESAEIADFGAFGFRSGRDYDKFEKVPFATDINGINYPTKDVGAVFSCKLCETVDAGTHYLFIGEVVDGKVLNEGKPMTYAYYHEVKKGKTAKNAPTF